MIVVFFIYGLAFFLLGVTILIYPKKGSAFKLADNLWLIAAFGITHGLNEWIDMFILIQNASDMTYLKTIHLFILPASFMFLILFGTRMITDIKKKCSGLKVLPVILPVTWGALIAVSDNRFLTGEIWARYLLCGPGTFLTSAAFMLQFKELKKTELRIIPIYLKLAASSLFLYGLFAGLVVPEAKFSFVSFLTYPIFLEKTGIPVQVLRAFSALVAMFAIMRVLGIFDWETKKKIRESEEWVRLLMESAEDIIVMQDPEGKYLYYNATPKYGLTSSDVLGKTPFDLFDSLTAAKIVERLKRVAASGKSLNEEMKITWRSETLWFLDQISPVRDGEGRITGLVTISRNITERKKLEEQLIHAQKMEAVGQLAGGVAHDFNNILTAIMGFTGILHMKMKEDDPLRFYLDNIVASSERAASLTHSLLAFSRKQIINPKPVDINEIIKKIEKILLRVIGEDIELNTALTVKDVTVMADSSQIEQVLMNLATNARDAMPRGGHLNIRTETVKLDDAFIRTHGYGEPGLYALISFTDSGKGMTKEIKERIFEPFFTTKDLGKGTGLGLSIVYGIIKQHNGYIMVYSEPEQGTTFRIYLPISESAVEKQKSSQIPVPAIGTETILLAEDEGEVRKIMKTVFEEFGYRVIEAANGADAIKKFAANRDDIRLLLMDIVMPQKNGREVYEEIKKMKPDIKVLFTSGYTADIMQKKDILEDGLEFISKPVSPTDLLRKVREILDK